MLFTDVVLSTSMLFTDVVLSTKCYSQMWCYRQNVIHRCGVIDKMLFTDVVLSTSMLSCWVEADLCRFFLSLVYICVAVGYPIFK